MDYNISVEYTLPSLGKVYPVQVNPVVRLRSMTTNDEMKRLSHSERQNKIMAEIIDDCIVSDLGISAYDLCVSDYQFLVHKLRVATYGPLYPISGKCKYCGAEIQDTINLDEISVSYYTDDLQKYLSFDLPISKHHIELKMQTPRMLDDIQVRSKELRRKSNIQGDSAFLYTIQSLIDKVDYEKLDFIKLEDFVNSLPMADANKIFKASDEIVDKLGLDLNLTLFCDVCGLTYTSPFRVTGEFFRPSVQF